MTTTSSTAAAATAPHAECEGHACACCKQSQQQPQLEPQPQTQKPINNIFDACKEGSMSALQHCLLVEHVNLNSRDETQTTPLHWAAYHGHVPVVHCLVSCGAVLDARNKDGQTPLHWAAMGGHQLVFHLLCSAGADVRAADARGYNAAHLAVQYGFPSLAFYAFNHGVKVDAVDNEGHTALHWAAYQNNEKAVLFLLRVGATLDAPDRGGKTPLHWACARAAWKACAALVDAGACVTAIDDDGETPVMVANRCNNGAMAKVLIRAVDTPMDQTARRRRAQRDALRMGLVMPAVLAAGSTLNSWLVVVPVLAGAFEFLKRVTHRDVHEVRNYGYFLWVASLMAVTLVFLFGQLLPATHSLAIGVPFVLFSAAYLVVTHRVLTRDPGTVEPNTFTQPLFEASLNRGNEIPEDRLCLSCLAIRPLRSHHCRICNRCVARFDHHCVWVNNCIGAGNHRYFLAFVTMSLALNVWSACLAGYYLALSANAPRVFPLVPFLYRALQQRPYALLLLLLHIAHGLWNWSLVRTQAAALMQNLTSDELVRWRKHKYLVNPATGAFVNPLDRGRWTNVKNYFTGHIANPFLTSVPAFDEILIEAMLRYEAESQRDAAGSTPLTGAQRALAEQQMAMHYHSTIAPFTVGAAQPPCECHAAAAAAAAAAPTTGDPATGTFLGPVTPDRSWKEA